MKERIEELRQSFEQELQKAGSSDAVERLRVAYLGKKGSVTELLKSLKDVGSAEKKEMGQHINALKRSVEERLTQRIEEIKAAEEQKEIESARQYDVTLPIGGDPGSYHPITIVQRHLLLHGLCGGGL